MSSFRISVLAGLVLVLSGCVTPSPRYYESHQEVVYRDGHYYATGNDRDGDYYYGREQPRYRYSGSYGYGGSGYWGLGRYSCGYYGSCWPYYGSSYRHGYGYGGSYWPQSNFSLSLGHSWKYGSLAWTGYWGGYRGGHRSYSGHGYRSDYRRHDRRHDSRYDSRFRSRSEPGRSSPSPSRRSEPARRSERLNRVQSSHFQEAAPLRERSVSLQREPRRTAVVASPRAEPVRQAVPMPRSERLGSEMRPVRADGAFQRRGQASPQPRPMPVRAVQKRSDKADVRDDEPHEDDKRERGQRRETLDRR